MKSKTTFCFLFYFVMNTVLSQTTTTNIFDQVLFYDGYAGLVSNPTPAGVTRLRNDLFTRKLSQSELLNFGDAITMNLFVKAACDNYDRIGNINLAFVPKDQTSYNPENTSRIELARFITPFMNKNVAPDTVPYVFVLNNVAKIFKDANINSLYDIWIELQIFGVPYAANTQVAGCANRNDVFYGTLDFVSNAIVPTANELIIPINFQNNLNNYQVGASDAVGTTTRTVSFNVNSNVTDANFHLITSNHGANSGGEEYNRRFHYIDFNGTQLLSYRPGETTCEPYRIYNTQGNGIYGPSPRTPGQWQSFSNWCPGSKILNRTIPLGNVNSGTNTFRIRVPSAVFANGEGNFPISVYLQGTNTGLATNKFEKVSYSIQPNPSKDFINIDTNDIIENITIVDILGREYQFDNNKKIDISSFKNGVYFLKLKFENFEVLTEKIIKN